MIGPLDFNLPEPKTALMVDAMYLGEAERALERIKPSTSEIESAKTKYQVLKDAWDRVQVKYQGNSYRATHELEPIAIQMEDAESQISEAYAPVLQAVAVAHVLSGACLEAHINARGIDKLSTKHFEIFERFSLEAKWLSLPKFVGVPGFDVSAEPFQSFSRLVKVRNSLVHYKTKKESWYPPGVPKFLQDLALTEVDARKSVDTSKQMIIKLAEQLGEEPPIWTRMVSSGGYFAVDFQSLK